MGKITRGTAFDVLDELDQEPKKKNQSSAGSDAGTTGISPSSSKSGSSVKKPGASTAFDILDEVDEQEDSPAATPPPAGAGAPAAVPPAPKAAAATGEKQAPASKATIDKAFGLNLPSAPSINVAGQSFELDDDIPAPSIPFQSNQKEIAAKELQERINTRTYTPEDLTVVSGAMKRSTASADAYLRGNAATGHVIHFNDIKKEKGATLSSALEQANADLGLEDDFATAFASAESAGAYLQKIENAYSQKTHKQGQEAIQAYEAPFDADNPFVTEDIAAANKKNETVNSTAAQKIKAIIADDIVDKVSADTKLTKDQKVKKIHQLVDGKDEKDVREAIDQRLTPVRWRMDFAKQNIKKMLLPGFGIPDSSTEGDFDLLNHTKGSIELKLNRTMQDELAYNQALVGSIVEEANSKGQNITEEEARAYNKRISDVRLNVARLEKEVVPDKDIYAKYPTMMQKALADAVNDYNAVQSGNVKGEDVQYAASLPEFLQSQGFDTNDQKVKDFLKGDNFKDYSIIGRPISNAVDVFTSSAKAIGDITGLRDEATILAEKRHDELFTNQVGENDRYQLSTLAKLGQNVGSTTGQVLGQGLLQSATLGLGRVAGLSKLRAASAAFWTSGALTSYDQAYKDAGDFIENGAGKIAYAGLIALSNAASEKIFPEVKLFQIPGVADGIAELSKKIGTAGFTDELARELLDKTKKSFLDYAGKYAKEYGKNVGQETVEEVATSLFESATRFVFGDPKMNFNKAIGDATDTAIQTASGMLFVGAMGAHKDIRREKNTSATQTLYEAAINHDVAADAINKGFSQNLYNANERNEKIKTLNTAQTAVQALSNTEKVTGKELGRSEKAVYVANLTAESLFKEQLQGTTDELAQNNLKEKISNLQNQRKQLLDGEVTIDDDGNIVIPKKKEEVVPPPAAAADTVVPPADETAPAKNKEAVTATYQAIDGLGDDAFDVLYTAVDGDAITAANPDVSAPEAIAAAYHAAKENGTDPDLVTAVEGALPKMAEPEAAPAKRTPAKDDTMVSEKGNIKILEATDKTVRFQDDKGRTGRLTTEKFNEMVEAGQLSYAEQTAAAPAEAAPSEDVALKTRINEKGIKNYTGDNISIPEIQEQSLQAPASLQRQFGNDEGLVTDLIAKNTPQQIEDAIKYQEERLSDPNLSDEELDEVDGHISLLEKGQEKQKASAKPPARPTRKVTTPAAAPAAPASEVAPSPSTVKSEEVKKEDEIRRKEGITALNNLKPYYNQFEDNSNAENLSNALTHAYKVFGIEGTHQKENYVFKNISNSLSKDVVEKNFVYHLSVGAVNNSRKLNNIIAFLSENRDSLDDTNKAYLSVLINYFNNNLLEEKNMVNKYFNSKQAKIDKANGAFYYTAMQESKLRSEGNLLPQLISNNAKDIFKKYNDRYSEKLQKSALTETAKEEVKSLMDKINKVINVEYDPELSTLSENKPIPEQTKSSNKKATDDATKKRNKPKNSKQQYKDGNESGEATSPGSSNSNEQSGESKKEAVANDSTASNQASKPVQQDEPKSEGQGDQGPVSENPAPAVGGNAEAASPVLGPLDNIVTDLSGKEADMVAIGGSIVDRLITSPIIGSNKRVVKVMLETLTTKEENQLYNNDQEYRELYDRDGAGTLDDAGRDRMTEIYKSQVIKKQLTAISKQYNQAKEAGEDPGFVAAVEEILSDKNLLSNEPQTITRAEQRDTAIIVSSAEVVISQAEAATKETEVDAAVDKIETALDEVVSKIGKLTEVYTTEGIDHEYPNVQIGKKAAKEIKKYAKEIARILQWTIPEKLGVLPNIAPAGGDVVFRFDVPGTSYQMHVQVNYQPEYGDSYDNYGFNGLMYYMQEVDSKGQYGKRSGANQWQRENITAKELAQILKNAADKFLSQQPAAAPANVEVKAPVSKPPAQTKEVPVVRKVRDEKLRSQIDDALNDFFSDSGLLTTGGLDPKKIESGVKIIGLYMKAGVYKFSDIIEDAYAKFGDKVKDYFEALKTVYGGYYNSQATEQEAELMDSNIRKFTFDNIIKNVTNDGQSTTAGESPVDQGTSGLGTNSASGSVQQSEGEKSTIGVGDNESAGSNSEPGFNGTEGQPASRPSGRVSQGQSSVAVNGNEELNAELGGESVEQKVPEPAEQTPVVTPVSHNGNFVIPPDFTNNRSFNVAQKLQDNINAVRILITLKNEDRRATYEEQKELFKYVGFGGIKEVGFDPNSNNGWAASNIGLRPKVKEFFDVLKEFDENGYKANLEAVKRSTQNAHYTAIPVIRAMYNVLRQAGFKGGTVLEPSSGTGNFIGAMPFDMLEKSRVGAVELDPLTGSIYKALYPNTSSVISGYEKVPVGKGSVDLVISNIPFGNVAVSDVNFLRSKDKTLKASLKKVHAYFFARGLQDVKPGGLVAFVTSTGILDSNDNADLRRMIADQAEFMGAIRLPNDAFKGNANTSVTTDIIFLRKFKDTEPATQKHQFEKTETKNVKHKNKDENFNVKYNEYFHKNPEMILGEVEAGSMYGASKDGLNDTMTVTPTGIDIEKAISDLAEKIFPSKVADSQAAADEIKPSTSYVQEHEARPGNLVQISEGVYGVLTGDVAIDNELDDKARAIGLNPDNIRQDNITSEEYARLKANGLSAADFKRSAVTPVRIAKKYLQAVKDLLPLRAALNKLYIAEYTDMKADYIEAARKELKSAYDTFKKNNGTLLENKLLLALDIDGHNLSALENVTDKKVTGLADIFTKRVFEKQKRAESAGSMDEAIALNLSETGRVDLDRLAELLKMTPDEAIEAGKGIIFKNPEGGFETKDQYLSGNVRKKLQQAELAAKSDKFYDANVVALQAVQPANLTASQIYAPISAPWIDNKYLAQFASELFGVNVMVNKLSTGRVNAASDGRYQDNVKIREEYGTPDMNGLELLEEAIQNRMPIVKRTISRDPLVIKVDEKATQAAAEKMEKVKKAFDAWIWRDDTRRQALSDFYNENFNHTIIRSYDGSHLKFEGYAGVHEPRQHQKDGVWMIAQQMGGIIDHIVGSGKTLLMVLSAMKMKKMGLIKKPIIVGLKANAEDIATAYKASFPLAKVLYPSAKDFTPDNRRAFFAKMANNDWDAIVMTHDQFGMIPQSVEVQQKIITEEIENLEADIRTANDNNMSKRDLKGLETRKQNLEAKLSDLTAMKKDDTLPDFVKMGIDFMYVDESQQFKNLTYSTIQRGVSGLGDPKGAAKSFNMLFAIRSLQEMYGADKGTVFASGTPISNTMVEMFLLFKYLRPNTLREMALETFDRWANTFARIGSEIEFGVTNSLKPKVRMREFMNVPEMAAMYREIADVRNDSNLKIPKPVFKKTIRLKTDKVLPLREIITIGENQFKVIGKIKGIEKNENWISLMAVGKDPKIESTGTFSFEGETVNYSNVEYTDGLLVNVTPTQQQRKFAKAIQKFAETKDGRYIGMGDLDDNKKKAYMLLATNLASKMAIDMRLIDPTFPSSEAGKLAVAADTVYDHYRDSEQHKGVQLIFSDLGTPKATNTQANLFDLLESRGIDKDTLESIFGTAAFSENPKFPKLSKLRDTIQEVLEYTDDDMENAISEANEDNFNIYQEIKDKLVKRGMPANEIAFIHDYNTDLKKKQLFEDANNGRVRVIIGSTSKLGTGVNVQKKIVALHHIDVPWRPSDMEQRNGRGIRQGNDVTKEFYNNELPVYYYATESTLDAYKYQLLDTKQQFIDQAKTGNGTAREISEGDGDEENGVSFAAMTAMLSGNPVLLEKAKIDKKVKEIEGSKKTFDQEKYDLADKIKNIRTGRSGIASNKARIKEYQKDKVQFEENSERNPKTKELVFKASLNGVEYKKREEIGKAIIEAQEKMVAQFKADNPNWKKYDYDISTRPSKKIGEIAGFDIQVEISWVSKDEVIPAVRVVSRVSKIEYDPARSQDPVSLGSYLQREIRDADGEIEKLESNIKTQEKSAQDRESYLASLPTEFPREKEYQDALATQKRLDERLKEIAASNLPSVDDLENLGERVMSNKITDFEDLYAMNEDNIVSKINDAEEYAQAKSEDSRFYRYAEEKLQSEDDENDETDDDDEDEDVNFSSQADVAAFESENSTDATLEDMQKKYPDAIVVQRQSQLPAEIRKQARKQGVRVIEGVYANGKVYLVADNIDTMGRAEGVYRHETIGHKGVISVLKEKLTGFVNDLVDNATGMQMVALNKLSQSLYGRDISNLSPTEVSIVGQEYMAIAAEKPKSYPTTWEKIKSFIKGVLRDLGIKTSVSDSDIKVLLDRAEKFVARPERQSTAWVNKLKTAAKIAAVAGMSFNAVSAEGMNNDSPAGKNKPSAQATKDSLVKKFGKVMEGRWNDYRILSKKAPGVNKTYRQIFSEVGETYGIPPELLFASSSEEGLRDYVANPNETTGDKDFPVSGYASFGLDNFTEVYPELVKRGFLADDFPYQEVTAVNEKNQTVKTANFADAEDAITAKAAMLSYMNDKVVAFADKNNIEMSPAAQDFFMLVAYNAGLGNATKMLSDYNAVGALEGDRFLNARPTRGAGKVVLKDTSWSEPYTNAIRRTVPATAWKPLFEDSSTALFSSKSASIAPDLQQFGDDFIKYMKYSNSNVTADEVIAEMEKDRGVSFSEIEADLLYDYVRSAMYNAPPPRGKKASERTRITSMVNAIGQNNQDAVLDGITHRDEVGSQIAASGVSKEDKIVLSLISEDAVNVLGKMKEFYKAKYLTKALYWLENVNKNKVSLDKRLAFGIALENEINDIKAGYRENDMNVDGLEMSRVYAAVQAMNALNAREGSKTLNTARTLYDYFENEYSEPLLTPDQKAEKDAIMNALTDPDKLAAAAETHETSGTAASQPSTPKPAQTRAPRKSKKIGKDSTAGKLNDILTDLKEKLKNLDC